MESLIDKALVYGAAAAEAFSEALWPTRCVVCDMPGDVLCDRCRLQLPYLDWWRACPVCGAPHGRTQCTECNRVMLARVGQERPPFDACASTMLFESGAARIVRAYKDQGERRLAGEMAIMMANTIHPLWARDSAAIVAIPATAKAVRLRGFDHMEEIAQRLADALGLPTARILARPKSVDQRALGRSERFVNLEGRFHVLPGATVPSALLLVDDVYTTGATLFAASEALRVAGAQRIHCLTFARVY